MCSLGICNRIQLCKCWMAKWLKRYFNWFSISFSFLLMRCCFWFNSKETIEFIEYIKSENPNKKFIFIFKPSNYAKALSLDVYENCKDVIEKCSDDIFILERIDHFNAELRNLKTKQTDKYKCLIDDSFKDYLKKDENE